MTADPSAELRAELGADLDDVLTQLTPEESAQLLAMFRDARTEQARVRDASITETLAHLPAPIRPAARKIMFG